MRPAHDKKLEDRPQKFSVAQTEFLHAFAASPYMSERQICKQIGLSQKKLSKWKKDSENFKEAMAQEYRRSQVAANMNRKTVLNGMLKAVEMAEDHGQPSSMITGWKEIARICGYYEPERREILLSVDNRANLLEQIQELPKEKLLELYREHRANGSLDGEFEVVDAP